MKEVFKDIKGYEGIYQISNLGNVKSIRRNKLLKQKLNKTGYYSVVLSVNSKIKCYLTHRLVAETFITNPDNLPCVNHKDEDKSNNFVYVNEDGTVDLEKSNLEWCNYLYNNTYGNRIKKYRDRRCKRVIQKNKQNIIVKEWLSAGEIAKTLNYTPSVIYGCCEGLIKSAYGFIWEYKEVS